MTDIKLLPLPEADDSVENRAQWPIVIDSDVWLQKSMQDYALANVAHATEPLKAEIEALRAEVGTATRMHAITRGHLEAAEARAERLAEALRRAEGLLRSAGIIAESDLERPHSIATEIKNALRDHDQEVRNE